MYLKKISFIVSKSYYGLNRLKDDCFYAKAELFNHIVFL